MCQPARSIAARFTIGVLLLSLPALTACTTVSRGLGKMTANKYAKARSGTVWVVPPPQLEPPALDKKTVYISYRNLSDADIDLTDLLRETATGQGWTLTRDPKEASYRLRAQTRFFGEVAPETGGSSVGDKMGWIAGAAVGLGTYKLASSATDDYAIGAAAGVAAGGLAGLGISNASKPREWALITDFVLEEYSEQAIEFELLQNNTAAGSSNAGVSGPRSGETGGTGSSNSRSTSMKQSSNFYPHGIRLSAWANQMNMDEEEAMPLILERTRKVVRQMLPQ